MSWPPRFVLAEAMERRKSLLYCGATEEDIEALHEHDETFYGFEKPENVSSSEDSDSDDESLAQRHDYGADESYPSGDEYFSSGEDFGATGGGSPLRGDEADVVSHAYFYSKVRENRKTGCGCVTNHWRNLPADAVETLMVNIAGMSKCSKKQYIMGELAAMTRVSAPERVSVSYAVLGQSVCRGVFLEIHGVSKKILQTLLARVEEQATTPPDHGSAGRSPSNKISAEVTSKIVQFLCHFASCNGIPQPAAARGRCQQAPIFLPAHYTKKKIYKLYQEMEGTSPVGLSTFKVIWRRHANDIQIMKPRTDVCASCDKLREGVRLSKTEEGTREAMEKLAAHINEADDERGFYKSIVEKMRQELEDTPEGCVPGHTHITFDYAQQLELPHHTRQVGPIYFKSRFKMQLFGICNEARNTQHNFLFHEGECIGLDGAKAHGPNAVVSMLHYQFENFVKEKIVYMHANNCVGQNKNKTVIAYLCWRVLCGLSEELTLSFMRVGHTRCSVDAKFGRLKQSFRKSDVDSVADVVTAVAESCAANIPLRYCWQWRAWDEFLFTHFLPVKGICKYQHFHVVKSQPGVVVVKRSCTAAEETTIPLLRPSSTASMVTSSGLPPILPPGGISAARRTYLEKQIKEHLSQDATPPWC